MNGQFWYGYYERIHCLYSIWPKAVERTLQLFQPHNWSNVNIMNITWSYFTVDFSWLATFSILSPSIQKQTRSVAFFLLNIEKNLLWFYLHTVSFSSVFFFCEIRWLREKKTNSNAFFVSHDIFFLNLFIWTFFMSTGQKRFRQNVIEIVQTLEINKYLHSCTLLHTEANTLISSCVK